MATVRTCLVLWISLGFSCALDAQDVSWGVAKSLWPAGLGNQRARVEVATKADVVQVHVPWRRRDTAPEKKNIVVVNAAGKTVPNRVAVQINREYGDVVFQADTPGEYFVYYMPFVEKMVDWSYSMEYAAPQATAERAWLERNGLAPERLRNGTWRTLPAANVVEFQTWDEFHRFDPMEVIATAAETKRLVADQPDRAYLLFAEDRKFPIRMSDDLPLRWIRSGPCAELRGEACRGEFYVFQVGLYAARKPIQGLAVSHSSDLPGSSFCAFNLDGTDLRSRPWRRLTCGASAWRSPIAARWPRT
jgi:hypothetical protein